MFLAVLAGVGISFGSAGPLRVGYPQSPPLAYTQADGRAAGFYVDVLNEAAQRAGIQILWRQYLAGSAEEALRRGEVDIVPALYSTPARRREFFLSEPWWSPEWFLITLRDSEIRTEGDLRGKRLATLSSPLAPVVQEHIPGAQVVANPSPAAALSALCDGSVQAAALTRPHLYRVLLTRPESCRVASLRTFQTTFRGSLAIASTPAAAGAARRLRGSIDEMARSGALAAVADRHPTVGTWPAALLANRLGGQLRQQRTTLVTILFVSVLAVSLVFSYRQWRLHSVLRRSRDEMQLLLDNVPVGVWFTDAEGAIRGGNARAKEIWGGAGENVRTFPIFHPETGRPLEDYERTTVRALKSGQCILNELHEIQPFDGSKRKFVLNSAVPMRDASGKIVGAICTNQDVTQLVHAQRALATSEQRLRHMIANAPMPIILHAEDGEILQTNHAWQEITGYSPEEVRTIEEWTRRAYGDSHAEVKEYIQTLYEREWNERLDEGIYEVRTANGQWRIWYFGSAALGKDESGRRLVVSMAADITDLQRAQEEIRVLSGLLPICAACKRIRDDDGQWQQMETYIHAHSEAQFSHSYCPNCLPKYMDDVA